MKICAIIPARYDSKRLPGKPLIILNKKTILEKTYRQIAKVIDEKDIYVLTDSNKVINTLKNKIKNFVLTPKIYNTGVERCAHNFKKIKKKYKGYLIVSCDFPHIPTLALKETIKNFCKIANIKNYAAATVHTSTKDKSIIKSTKIPKIILNNQNDILYLSRFPIPSIVSNLLLPRSSSIISSKVCSATGNVCKWLNDILIFVIESGSIPTPFASRSLLSNVKLVLFF